MSPTPTTAEAALLHLVERAERGALLPDEAALLRRGIRSLAEHAESAQRARRNERHRERRRLARVEADEQHGGRQ